VALPNSYEAKNSRYHTRTDGLDTKNRQKRLSLAATKQRMHDMINDSQKNSHQAMNKAFDIGQ